MRILIIDTYYEFFLKEFYRNHSDLKQLSYDDHWRRLVGSFFSASDAYSNAFNKNGCEAKEVIFNDNFLQLKWARENGVSVQALPSLLAKGFNVLFGFDWRFKVLKEQIRQFKPDVIYIKEQSLLTDAMVVELKSMTRIIAQQVGTPPMWRRKYTDVDLTFTSLPHFVPVFEKMGLKAHYLRICFDPRVINKISNSKKEYEVSFVGGITSKYHHLRNELLEKTARDFPMKWFGYSLNKGNLSQDLEKTWQGNVWGLDLYEALAKSWVTINIHADFAAQYANNVRLYEATGVGTCLLTDWKENLGELFEIDQEVVAYKDPGEYFEKLKYLLTHKDECEKIGKAAQRRTLKDHTFDNRAQELIQIFKKSL